MSRILLFSSGMDSFISWYFLNKPPCLHITGHSRYSEKELQVVLKLMQLHTGMEIKIIRGQRWLRQFEHEDADIPLRNAHFALIAAHFGDHIYIPCQRGEQSIPDRSPKFFKLISELISYLSGKQVIVDPVFPEFSKQDMVRWYLDQGYPKEYLYQTYSCESEEPGRCGACKMCLVDNPKNKVWTLNGFRTPSQIKVGDSLLGYDHQTGFSPTEVKEIFIRYETNGYYDITLRPTNSKSQTPEYHHLLVTREHPIYEVNRGWLPAEQLKTGDVILQLTHNEFNSVRMKHKNPMTLYPERNCMHNPEIVEKVASKNRGRPNPKARERMLTDNPMWHPEISAKQHKTIRERYTSTSEEISAWGRRWMNTYWEKYGDEVRAYRKTEEYRKYKSENNPMRNPETARKVGEKIRELFRTSEEYRRKVNTKGIPRHFSDPDSCRRGGINSLRSQYNRRIMKLPSLQEQWFIDRFRELHLPIKYVGNMALVIGYKCPDFIIGQNKLLELHDEFWSPNFGEYERERKEHFAKYGYKTLVLNMSKLTRDEALAKILEFIHNGLEVVRMEWIPLAVKVYNYHCEPYNNYVVSGALVHNCARTAVALDYNNILPDNYFNKDIWEWEGWQDYIKRIKDGKYESRRSEQTMKVLTKRGLWR